MFNNLRDILGRKSDQTRGEQVDFSSGGDNENSAIVAAEGFICPMCKSGFPNADELQNHYDSNHVEGINNEVGHGRFFTCSACKMKLGSDIELQSHYSRHHTVTKKDQGEIEVLKMQVKALDEGKTLLRDELEFMHGQLKEYMKENVKLKEEKESLNLKEKDLVANNAVLVKEVEDKKILIEKYKAQSIERDQRIQKIELELENTKTELKQMKMGRDELFCKINEGEGATTAVMQLKEEIAKLIEDSSWQQNANDEIVKKLHQDIHDLNQEFNNSELKLKEYIELNSKLTAKLKESEESLSTVVDENKSLRSQLKEKQTDIDKKEVSHEHQLKEVQDEMNSVKNELNAKTEQLASVVNDLNMMLNDLKEENITLKEKMDEMQINKDTVIDQQKEKLSALQKECSLLSKQVEMESSTHQETTKQIGELQFQLHEANVKLTNMANDASDNKAIIDDYCQQVEVLCKEKTNYKENVEKLRLELNRMEDYDELCAKIKTYEQEILQLRSQIQISNSEKSKVINELDDAKNRFAKTTTDKTNTIINLQKLLADSKEAHNQDCKELQNMKQLNVDEKIKFQNEIQTMKQHYAETVEEKDKIIVNYKNENHELSQKADTLSSKVNELESLHVQRRQEWDQSSSHFQAQIGILNENINTLQEDLKSEKNQCQHLNEKLVEISGSKLELEAKLTIALDERTDLLERCRKSEDGNESLLIRNTELRRKLDDSIAALHELGRENQTLQIENLKHFGRKWADDSEVTHCSGCGKLFTVTIRKHHCRNCGDIFCNECSSKTAAVASSRKPVRVCQICYTELAK